MIKLFDEEFYVKADDDKFYLDDIFSQSEYQLLYGDMMNTRRNQISFLNKTLCGNGGTTGLIRYALKNNKGLLVLVPNVSICKSKEIDYKDNPDVCCVYGGSKEFNPAAQIVVATYDQFSALLHKLSFSGIKSQKDIWDMAFWGGRTVVVDEYHKLIDDSGYRAVCPKITELISKTLSPVILMSATPREDYIQMLRELLPERSIYSYTVQYPQDVSKYETTIDVYEVKPWQVNTIFKKMKDNPINKQLCVFYNSVKDIKKILGQIGDEACEVLCSQDSKENVGKYFSAEFNPEKKIHFMTSAYFTGHDIWTRVDKCVIVGSGDRDNMCLSERDIKQIIGRFRIEGGGVREKEVLLLYIRRSADQKNYLMNKNTYEQASKDIKVMGDKWMLVSTGVKSMHDLLRTKDALRRYDVWSSYRNLEKALMEYGFNVRNNTEFLKKLTLMENKKHMTFNEARERLSKGISVDFDEYPDINELKAYMDVKGVKNMMSKRTSKGYIHNWYKAYQASKDKDLKEDNGSLYHSFGIQTFGRYNAKYLKACLDFLDEEADYDNLPAMMYEKMGCFCVPWALDNKGHKQNNTWLVITNSPKSVGLINDTIIVNDTKKTTVFGETVMNSNLSYETSSKGSSCARTTTWKDALENGKILSLSGIPLYDWVIEDKKTRLPQVKKDKEWTSIKRFSQTKLSEMYKDTNNVYRYIRAEMNLADCLIIDVDDGLRFSDFQKMYGKWRWFSYPTISNITDDWTKFRVIIPLAKSIRLEGEHNLKVLKCLRTMFCPYEDPNHQVYSYANIEDFTKLVGNDGETYEIPQDFIDCLEMCIKESYDYKSMKFEKKKVSLGGNFKSHMSLNYAKSKFLQAMADPADGVRHDALLYIKLGLSYDDRIEFERWLISVYPRYYKEHWITHHV